MTAVAENIRIQEYKEVRLRNVLKKKLLSVSKPFDLMQALYLLSMYKVRDGFIIPNSVFYNVVSGIWSLLSSVSYFFCIFNIIFIDGLGGFNSVKFFNNIPMFVAYCFGNMATYWTNVIQRHDNVRLAINIQNICETLMVNGKCLKNFTLLNWVYVIVLNSYRVFWIITINLAFSKLFRFEENITSLLYIIFDIKMLYSIRLMKLISEALRTWVEDARKSILVTDTDSELYWDRKFTIYMEIVETYKVVGKIFQTLVLYYCIDTFTNGVLSIWLRIEIAKVVGASMIKVALSLISLLWLVKNMLLVSTLCLECERFYSMMTEVRSTCILLTTSESCSETQKRVCKNIERVQTVFFKKMSACGLFDIDGVLPLLLCSLLTTYIIVVLQFEFL